MRTSSTRVAVTTLAVTALMAVGGSAVAATDDTSVTVTGGTLAITAAPTAADFAGITLDGTAKSTTATLSGFAVGDSTGTGAGWKVTAQATQFTSTDMQGPVRTLAADSLTLSAPTVSGLGGTTSTAPAVMAGPYILGSDAVTIASAAVDTGMGEYQFTDSTMTLNIPASAYAGTYTSKVTISATTGP